MADLSPSAQPRASALPALVEALPPDLASTHKSLLSAHPGPEAQLTRSDEPVPTCADGQSTFTRERQVVSLHALAASGAVRAAVAAGG